MIVNYLELGFVFCLSDSRCLYSTKWYWPLFTWYIYTYNVYFKRLSKHFRWFRCFVYHWFTHFSTNCFSWKFLSFFCLFFCLFKETENFFRILFSTTIKSSSHNFARSFFSTFWFISYDNTQQRKWQPRRHDIIEIRSIYVLWKKNREKNDRNEVWRRRWESKKKTLRHVKHIHSHIRTNTTVYSFWSRVYGFARNVNIQNIEHHSPYWCVSVSISFRNSTTIALCQWFRTGAFINSFTQTQFLDF